MWGRVMKRNFYIVSIVSVVVFAVVLIALQGRFVDAETSTPEDGATITVGSSGNPYNILEIVPDKAFAEIGYLVGGQEPCDLKSSNITISNIGFVANTLKKTGSFDVHMLNAYTVYTADGLFNNKSSDLQTATIAALKADEANVDKTFVIAPTYYERVETGIGAWDIKLDGDNKIEGFEYKGENNGDWVLCLATAGELYKLSTDDYTTWVRIGNKSNQYSNEYGIQVSHDDPEDVSSIGTKVVVNSIVTVAAGKIDYINFVNNELFKTEALGLSDSQVSDFHITVTTKTPGELTDNDISDANLVYFNNGGQADSSKYATVVALYKLINNKTDDDIKYRSLASENADTLSASNFNNNKLNSLMSTLLTRVTFGREIVKYSLVDDIETVEVDELNKPIIIFDSSMYADAIADNSDVTHGAAMDKYALDRQKLIATDSYDNFTVPTVAYIKKFHTAHSSTITSAKTYQLVPFNGKNLDYNAKNTLENEWWFGVLKGVSDTTARKNIIAQFDSITSFEPGVWSDALITHLSDGTAINMTDTSKTDSGLYIIGWVDGNKFYYASNAQITKFSSDCTYMFTNTALQEIRISSISTADVVDFSQMFEFNTVAEAVLTYYRDVGETHQNIVDNRVKYIEAVLDCTSATKLQRLFGMTNIKYLNFKPSDASDSDKASTVQFRNTSGVVDFYRCFYRMQQAKVLDLRSLDFTDATTVQQMLIDAFNITKTGSVYFNNTILKMTSNVNKTEFIKNSSVTFNFYYTGGSDGKLKDALKVSDNAKWGYSAKAINVYDYSGIDSEYSGSIVNTTIGAYVGLTSVVPYYSNAMVKLYIVLNEMYPQVYFKHYVEPFMTESDKAAGYRLSLTRINLVNTKINGAWVEGSFSTDKLNVKSLLPADIYDSYGNVETYALMGIDNPNLDSKYLVEHNVLTFDGRACDFISGITEQSIKCVRTTMEAFDTLKIDEDDSISYGTAIQYLKNKQIKNAIQKPELDILELQPSNQFISRLAWGWRVSGLAPYYLGNLAEFNPQTTQMSTKQFIGINTDLNNDYDLIYIGADYGLLNTHPVDDVKLKTNYSISLECNDTVVVPITDLVDVSLGSSDIKFVVSETASNCGADMHDIVCTVTDDTLKVTGNATGSFVIHTKIEAMLGKKEGTDEDLIIKKTLDIPVYVGTNDAVIPKMQLGEFIAKVDDLASLECSEIIYDTYIVAKGVDTRLDSGCYVFEAPGVEVPTRILGYKGDYRLDDKDTYLAELADESNMPVYTFVYDDSQSMLKAADTSLDNVVVKSVEVEKNGVKTLWWVISFVSETEPTKYLTIVDGNVTQTEVIDEAVLFRVYDINFYDFNTTGFAAKVKYIPAMSVTKYFYSDDVASNYKDGISKVNGLSLSVLDYVDAGDKVITGVSVSGASDCFVTSNTRRLVIRSQMSQSRRTIVVNVSYKDSAESSYVQTAKITVYANELAVINHIKKLAVESVYNDVEMNGLMYSHVGDDYTIHENNNANERRYYDGALLKTGASDVGTVSTLQSRFSGNDITHKKLEELNDYLDSGFPVIISDRLVTISSLHSITGVNKNLIDNSSYLYEFITSNQGRLLYDSKTSSDIWSNAFNKRIDIKVQNTPPIYLNDGAHTINYLDESAGLNFTFNLTTYLKDDSNSYGVKLFIDDNADGIYTDAEELPNIIVRGNGVTIASTRLAANNGTTYTVHRDIPEEYIGMISWKLEVYNTSDSSIRRSITGISALDTPEDKRPDIIVVQLLNPNTQYQPTLNLDTTRYRYGGLMRTWETEFHTGMSSLKDFNINVLSYIPSVDNDIVFAKKAVKPIIGYKFRTFIIKGDFRDVNWNDISEKNYTGIVTSSATAETFTISGSYEYNKGKLEFHNKTTDFTTFSTKLEFKIGTQIYTDKEALAIFNAEKDNSIKTNGDKDTRSKLTQYLADYWIHEVNGIDGEKYVVIQFVQGIGLESIFDYNKEYFGNAALAGTALEVTEVDSSLYANKTNLDSVVAPDMFILGFSDMPDYGGVGGYTRELANTVMDKINKHIEEGKTVLFTHDTIPYSVISTETLSLSYLKFSNIAGMVRYGDGKDTAWAPNSARSVVLESEKQGWADAAMMTNIQRKTGSFQYSPYVYNTKVQNSRIMDVGNIGADNVFRGGINKAEIVNRGQITEYPYHINDTISVAGTHHQYWQLDLEGETSVWLTLRRDDPRCVNYNRDTRNNYYIYSRENIVYTGVGHSAGITSDEIKLFINTIVSSYKNSSVGTKLIIDEPGAVIVGSDTYIYIDSEYNPKVDSEEVIDDAIQKLARLKFSILDVNLISKSRIILDINEKTVDTDEEVTLENFDELTTPIISESIDSASGKRFDLYSYQYGDIDNAKRVESNPDSDKIEYEIKSDLNYFIQIPQDIVGWALTHLTDESADGRNSYTLYVRLELQYGRKNSNAGDDDGEYSRSIKTLQRIVFVKRGLFMLD